MSSDGSAAELGGVDVDLVVERRGREPVVAFVPADFFAAPVFLRVSAEVDEDVGSASDDFDFLGTAAVD